VGGAPAFKAKEAGIFDQSAYQLLVPALFHPAKMFIFPAVITPAAIAVMDFSHILSFL
jgi:hypothetical protein